VSTSEDAGAARQGATQPIEAQLQELFAPDGLTVALIQDLYIAEACLSVDAPEEAEFTFRRRMAEDQPDAARLSAAITLAQLFLLERLHDDYLNLAVDALIPLLHKSWHPGQATPTPWPTFDAQGILVLAGGLTLLPLATDEFLAEVDETRVARLAELLERLRPQASDDLAGGGIDVVLSAAYQRLNDPERVSAAKSRIGGNPVAAGWAPAGDLSHQIADLRCELRRWSQMDVGRQR
jgi:hypothetical protein